jgi:hypothetical protein
VSNVANVPLLYAPCVGQHDGRYRRHAANPMNDAKEMEHARDGKIVNHQNQEDQQTVLAVKAKATCFASTWLGRIKR